MPKRKIFVTDEYSRSLDIKGGFWKVHKLVANYFKNNKGLDLILLQGTDQEG